MKRITIAFLLAAAAMTVLAYPVHAEDSKTEPLEIVDTTHNGSHQDWTESAPSATPTPEQISALTGIPVEQVSVLKTVDYSTESYPVRITLSAPGTDDLPVCVLEYVNGGWIVVGSGTGPGLTVFLEQGGPISVAVQVPVLYEVTKGMGGVWYRTTTETLSFTCERTVDDPSAYSHFTGIEVDGNTVDPSHYTVVSGGMVLTLHPEYLAALELGEHQLVFRFDDGQAGTSFFVRPASESGTTPAKDTAARAPQTGDNGWLIATAVITAAAILGALELTRRREP